MKEVQVTLDGPRELHDARRPHKDGGGTFDRIAAGVDALLEAGVPVNLRVVADRENLPRLPELAAFAEARGWLGRPASRFKTQIGRNYELFGCASRQDRGALFDRVELWAAYVELCEAHPVLRRFHAPRFHGLSATSPRPASSRRPTSTPARPPRPSGPSRPTAASTAAPPRWATRPTGSGASSPVERRDEAAVARWSGRSTLTMPGCAGCALGAGLRRRLRRGGLEPDRLGHGDRLPAGPGALRARRGLLRARGVTGPAAPRAICATSSASGRC